MDDVVRAVGLELVRRDARHPDLRPGERIVLDFRAVPWPGALVLVRRDGAFALETAPTDAWIVAVVRVR